MDARSFRSGLLDPFYRKLSNPRWPHTCEEYTLEIRVDVERLRVEIVFL